MKKIIISSLLLFVMAIIFNACRKEDNPNLPDLERVSWIPLITKDASGDDVISGQDPESFSGKFNVNEYFQTDADPQKIDIVVIKNGNKAIVRIIKADVTTFPVTIEVTGNQLTSLFGATIIAGDNFEIGADITTKGGQKFEAFPTTGNAYASGIAAQPGASTSIVYIAICEFNKASFNGNYEVVQDDWADFAVGDLVEVKPGAGDNQIAITAYPSPAFGSNRKPMIINVNSITFAVTIPEQVIGDYDGAPPGATVRGSGNVNPCGDEITLTVTIKIGSTDYADQVLKLKK